MVIREKIIHLKRTLVSYPDPLSKPYVFVAYPDPNLGKYRCTFGLGTRPMHTFTYVETYVL